MKPRVHQGIPFCSDDSCPEYDGKRCRLLGSRPGNICEPAVDELVTKHNALQNQLPGLTATLDECQRRLHRVEATLVYMAHYAVHANPRCYENGSHECQCGLDTIMADYEALKPYAAAADLRAAAETLEGKL